MLYLKFGVVFAVSCAFGCLAYLVARNLPRKILGLMLFLFASGLMFFLLSGRYRGY